MPFNLRATIVESLVVDINLAGRIYDFDDDVAQRCLQFTMIVALPAAAAAVSGAKLSTRRDKRIIPVHSKHSACNR